MTPADETLLKRAGGCLGIFSCIYRSWYRWRTSPRRKRAVVNAVRNGLSLRYIVYQCYRLGSDGRCYCPFRRITFERAGYPPVFDDGYSRRLYDLFDLLPRNRNTMGARPAYSGRGLCPGKRNRFRRGARRHALHHAPVDLSGLAF